MPVEETEPQTTEETVPTQEGTEPPVEDQQETEPQLDEDSIGSQFLTGIEDEELRKQLTPYVQKWDAGVNRRFQEIHQQYRPYKELGEVEELQRARQMVQRLNTDPQGFLSALAQHLGVSIAQQKQAQQQAQQQQTVDDPDDFNLTFQKLSQPLAEKLEKQEKVLGAIAQFIQNQQQTQRQQQEQQEFETYINNLEKEFGKFDRDYVTALMAQGVQGPEAVKRYKQAVQAGINTNSRPQPKNVLGSGGAIPSTDRDVTELSKNETKQLVQDFLKSAAQG